MALGLAIHKQRHTYSTVEQNGRHLLWPRAAIFFFTSLRVLALPYRLSHKTRCTFGTHTSLAQTNNYHYGYCYYNYNHIHSNNDVDTMRRTPPATARFAHAQNSKRDMEEGETREQALYPAFIVLLYCTSLYERRRRERETRKLYPKPSRLLTHCCTHIPVHTSQSALKAATRTAGSPPQR